VEYLREEVGEGERLFVYGHEAYYYFLAARFYPWPFSQLYPGQAGGDEGRALVALLEREPPERVVSGMLSWPGMPALPGYTPLVVEYLKARYEVAPDVFLRHPPPGGRVPPAWTVTVLRPRGGSAASDGGDDALAGTPPARGEAQASSGAGSPRPGGGMRERAAAPIP
jgi:hypothetical protein